MMMRIMSSHCIVIFALLVTFYVFCTFLLYLNSLFNLWSILVIKYHVQLVFHILWSMCLNVLNICLLFFPSFRWCLKRISILLRGMWYILYIFQGEFNHYNPLPLFFFVCSPPWKMHCHHLGRREENVELCAL